MSYVNAGGLLSRRVRGFRRPIPGRDLTWDDEELEQVHDFIQWLFPLPDPSAFNPNAPLLSEYDIARFRADPALRSNMRKSFERILSFLGLAMTEDGKVVEGPNFALRAPDVWAEPNHNWLRITRILRSLTLLGLQIEALAMFAWLEAVYSNGRFPITADTFDYWRRAV